MQNSDDIYMLTTGQFNPHDDSYAKNEDQIMDWEGNMVENKHRTKTLLSEVEDNEAMADSVPVSDIESRDINCALETIDYEENTVKICYGDLPCAADDILSILGAFSPSLGNMAL